MNILFVPAENSRYSGAFLSMVKLVDILQNRYHHQVTVVLPRPGNGPGSGRELLNQHNIKSVFVPFRSWIVKIGEKNVPKQKAKFCIKKVLNFFADRMITIIIKQKRIDIVHINTSWTSVGAKAALKCNVPIVWHIREFLEEDQGLEIWSKEKGYALMKQATHVIAISQSIYDKYKSILGEKKLSVILNGIDSETFFVADHHILQGSLVNLLIIGNIREQKGQIDAIRACSLLHERGYINLRLSIVGQGEPEYVQCLKQLVSEFNAEEYISFCGSTNSPQEYYKKADIVLMCSTSEAFGRVTVEGMLSGALVIGAESAATLELIQNGKTGLLYTSGHADELAARIAYAIEYPEIVAKVANNGQQYALQNLTAERNADNINMLYTDISSQFKGEYSASRS